MKKKPKSDRYYDNYKSLKEVLLKSDSYRQSCHTIVTRKTSGLPS